MISLEDLDAILPSRPARPYPAVAHNVKSAASVDRTLMVAMEWQKRSYASFAIITAVGQQRPLAGSFVNRAQSSRKVQNVQAENTLEGGPEQRRAGLVQ